MDTENANTISHESWDLSSECRTTVELLPWWVRGTLEESERRQVNEHLASCRTCRQEARDAIWLAETGLEQHLPIEVVVGGVLDLPVEGWTASRMESHLAVCSRCRSEFDLVASDPTLVDVPSRVRVSAVAGRVRRWGLAAAAAVLVGSMALIQFSPAEEPSETRSSELILSEPALVPSPAPDPGDLFRDGFESGTTEWTELNGADDSGDESS